MLNLKEGKTDMSKYTKGRIEISQESINAIDFLSEKEGNVVAQIISDDDELTPTEFANAEEMVRRWNAFEEGGLVEQLSNRLRDSALAIQKLAPRDSKLEDALTKKENNE